MGRKPIPLHSSEQQRRWLLYCPGCSELWFVLNTQDYDEHICKGCGHRFTVKPSMRLPKAASSVEQAPLRRAA